MVSKLPLFSQSDPGSGLSETDHTTPVKRLLNAPEVWAGCWRPVMFSFPEADHSLVDPQLAGKALLGQPSKNTGSTKLAGL